MNIEKTARGCKHIMLNLSLETFIDSYEVRINNKVVGKSKVCKKLEKNITKQKLRNCNICMVSVKMPKL